MDHCKNCGAVLKSNICEYCLTDYGDKKKQPLFAEIESNKGVLRIDGKDFNVYLSEIITEDNSCSFTDSNGFIHREPNLTHKFTLIEY